MNWMDRVVAAISPISGLKRLQARALIGTYESFSTRRQAAGDKGTLASWRVNRHNRHTERLDREKMSDRIQDLVSNDPHAASVVDSIATNAVGTGLFPESQPNAAVLGWSPEEIKTYQAQAEWAFSVWSREADASGRWPFWGIQFLSIQSILARGEFLRVPVMVDEPQRNFSLAIQCIDPLRMFTPSDRASDAMNIRDGVELGDRGQPLAYWLSNARTQYVRHHPSSNQMVRVPAWVGHRPGCFHSFIPKEEGQIRGVSVLAPAVKFFRDLADYMDFELVGAIVAASFPVFVEAANPFETATSLDGYSGSTASSGKTSRYQELEPGQIMYGSPGQKPHVLKSERPSDSFQHFVERILRAVGAAAGMPYEVIAKDFSKTNYSSARAALLEAWRVFAVYRKWLVDSFCQPVWEMVLEEAFLRGMIKLPAGSPDWYDARQAYTRALWIPPRRGHVDPVKEMQALILGLQNNITTLADAAAETGGDWESRLEQRARERELERKLNIEPPAASGAVRETEDDDKRRENDR